MGENMYVSTSKLRENIYKLLDQVLETGRPIEILRKGKKLKIIPETKKSKLQGLTKRKITLVDPDSLVSMDWSKEWKWKF